MFRKYRFIKVLNKGEYSTIFQVEHRALHCFRIVKRISKHSRYYERLMNEAYILKSLCHPNIPVIYDMEEDSDYSYIIEEYLEGESLKAFRFYQTFIREDAIIDIAKQICNLFQLLHSTKNPILYLDLKPENIIISHGRIKLIDFGASIYLNEMEKREVSFGTKGYSAPEQYGIKNIDARSDIYGIGAILYFLMTGNSFSEASVKTRKLDPEGAYSTALKKIVLKCLRKNPGQRYQSVEQLGAALVKAKKTLPTSKPLRIAVAGTKRGIGTSHVCILLASYVNRYMGDAVYVEKSENKILPSLLKGRKEWKMSDHVATIGHCKIWLDDEFDENQAKEAIVCILDYGVAHLGLKDELEKADRILFVAGGKEWEYKDTARCMETFFEYKDIVYVLNHIEKSQLHNAMHIWNGREFLMAPHHPNPFAVNSSLDIGKFVDDVLKEKWNAKRHNGKKKTNWLWKRR